MPGFSPITPAYCAAGDAPPGSSCNRTQSLSAAICPAPQSRDDLFGAGEFSSGAEHVTHARSPVGRMVDQVRARTCHACVPAPQEESADTPNCSVPNRPNLDDADAHA